jgi:hypothetical protein
MFALGCGGDVVIGDNRPAPAPAADDQLMDDERGFGDGQGDRDDDPGGPPQEFDGYADGGFDECDERDPGAIGTPQGGLSAEEFFSWTTGDPSQRGDAGVREGNRP